MECRAGAVPGKQPKSVANVHRCNWARLASGNQLFNVNPNFQFVALTDNSATSDYHALQLKFQRRLSQGLQALASYTFSHSIDIASTDAFATYLNTPGVARKSEYRPRGFGL